MMRTHSAPSRVLVLLAVLAIGILLLLATAAAATGSSQPSPKLTTYVVQSGDNLWSITEAAYGDHVDIRRAIDDIKKVNALDGSALSVGQVLLLPPA